MLIDYMMKDNITKKIVYSRSLEEVYLIVCCEENFSNTLYRDMMKEWMREKQNIN